MPETGKNKKGTRLPREERMKAYQDVELINCDMPFDRFQTPVMTPDLGTPGNRFNHVMLETCGKSQRKFADLLGIQQSAVSKIVNGTMKPGFAQLKNIAAKTKFTADWVLNGESMQRPEIVCIELTPGAAPLTWHEHKPNSVYVFGPEDGSVSKSFKGFCHTFLYIPSKHCLNLAAAVYTVLYDRQHKSHFEGKGAPLAAGDVSNEDRGWIKDWGENGR